MIPRALVRAGQGALLGGMLGLLWGIWELAVNAGVVYLRWGLLLYRTPWSLHIILLLLGASTLVAAALGLVVGLALGGVERGSTGGRGAALARLLRAIAGGLLLVALLVFVHTVLLPNSPPSSPAGIAATAGLMTLAAVIVLQGHRRERGPRPGDRAAGSVAWTLGIIGLLCAAAIAAPGHRLPPLQNAPSHAAPADRPNLLLLTLDTTRPDHLGCYGRRSARTPTLDRLAREGVLFRDALCQVPVTLPSHISLLTSTYPPRHGVRSNREARLADSALTLAEILRDAGYSTAAFVSGYPLARQFGCDQGFATYDDDFMMIRTYFTMAGIAEGAGKLVRGRTLARIQKVGHRLAFAGVLAERSAERTTDRAVAWLSSQKSPPFFLWVHYYDPHWPLNPPPPYRRWFSLDAETRARIAERIRRGEVLDQLADRPLAEFIDISLYDGEIAYVDAQVARLLDALERRGWGARTLVIATADHGEHLLEHDYYGHARRLYEPSLRIPLIMRFPGRLSPGQEVRDLVESVDILPTALALLEIPCPSSAQGRSLLSQLAGERPAAGLPAPAYAETRDSDDPHEHLYAVRAGRWKMIDREDGDQAELYDLERDAGEEEDLSRAEPDTVEHLRQVLAQLSARYGGQTLAVPLLLGPEAQERLRALGYVQ